MAEFIFVGHKLTRVILPERLFTFIPKGAFISLLRAVGQAKIDEAKRSATADYREKQTDRTADPVIPAMAQISGALGVPKEITGTDQAVLWRYRYRRASPNQRSGQIDMTFGFNPTTRKIQRLRGRLFDLTMDFSFTSSAAAPAATPAP